MDLYEASPECWPQRSASTRCNYRENQNQLRRTNTCPTVLEELQDDEQPPIFYCRWVTDYRYSWHNFDSGQGYCNGFLRYEPSKQRRHSSQPASNISSPSHSRDPSINTKQRRYSSQRASKVSSSSHSRNPSIDTKQRRYSSQRASKVSSSSHSRNPSIDTKQRHHLSQPASNVSSPSLSRKSSIDSNQVTEPFVNEKANESKPNKPSNDEVELPKSSQDWEPFFYCRWVAKYPKIIFYTCLLLNFILVTTSGALMGLGYDVIPAYFEDLHMELFNIPYRLRDVAYKRKDEFPHRYIRAVNKVSDYTRERGLMSMEVSVDMFFDAMGGNIFTKPNLLQIRDIEEALMLTDQYQTNWCMTNSSSLTCNKPISVLRFFDGTLSALSPVFDDPNFDNISGVLHYAYNDPRTRKNLEFFLPKVFTLTSVKAEADLTRSIFPIGCSYYGAKNCTSLKNYNPVNEFSAGPLGENLNKLREKPTGFEMYFYSFVIFRSHVVTQVMKDLLYAIGSILFIFSFMVFHTRSLWVTSFAVLSILTSFWGANVIYRYVIGFQYFGVFHVLVIFIILGIGADDLFVFYDSWRLTAFRTYPSLAHRLSDSYSKSSLSMLITSVTTMAAFMCSALSPFLETKSFGVFAGVLIMYNYVSVIIFFPAVVVVYHNNYESFRWPIFRLCKQNRDSVGSVKKQKFKCDLLRPNGHVNAAFVTQREPQYFLSFKTENEKDGYEKNEQNFKMLQKDTSLNCAKVAHGMQYPEKPSKVSIAKETKQNKYANEDIANVTKKKEKKLVVFFRDYYGKFVTNSLTQKLILPIFTIIIVFLSYEASSLQPSNEWPQLYKDHHHFSKSIKAEMRRFLFSPAENLVQVKIVWGLKESDRSGCHFSKIKCYGPHVYDEAFDPNPVANQQALMEFCDYFEKLSAAEVSKFRIKRNPDTHKLEVACFTHPLNRFLENVGSQVGYNISLPWNYTHISTLMTLLPGYFDVTKFNESFPNILQIPLQLWLYNGYTYNISDDYRLYTDLIGEQIGPWSQPLKAFPAIKYGNKIKYLTITINTTINRYITGYTEGIPVVERWESFVKSRISKMPKGLQGGFQFTHNDWHWFYIQKELADNAFLGIGVGIGLAFIILCLSTMNIVIGFFATLSISCTTICVVGMIPLLGWKLGVLPSLNMCIVVGVAVDYVVHLAEGYHLSKHSDRINRTRDMLEEMGPSVFSGACTTLGASVFMFFTEIRFFIQFGMFLFCTIGFSLLFSVGLFSVLMASVGPENDTGSITVLFKKCFSYCTTKNENKNVNK